MKHFNSPYEKYILPYKDFSTFSAYKCGQDKTPLSDIYSMYFSIPYTSHFNLNVYFGIVF